MLVTCLCLTRNRKAWLRQAIACYQQQTYPDRELLILADGEDVSDVLPGDDSSIRLMPSKARTIGEKRNLGCEHANGELIAHWDDDDFSAPDRLADQVNRLGDSDMAVTGYSSMLFTDGHQWWRYIGVKHYPALGTSLLYLKKWWQTHRFPPKQTGEDGDFARAAAEASLLISVDAGERMVATIHKHNTSPRRLQTDQWKRVSPAPTVPGFEWPTT